MIFNPTVVGGGIELPTLSNPGSAADLRNGKQLLGPDGQPITGTLKDVTLATPTITAASNGTITATVNQQSAGYIGTGSKSGTLKLSSAHDSDFIPANIKSGVNIFGVTGTYQPPATESLVEESYENGNNISVSSSAPIITLTLAKNCERLVYLYVYMLSNDESKRGIIYFPAHITSSGVVERGELLSEYDNVSGVGVIYAKSTIRDTNYSINGQEIVIDCSGSKFETYVWDYGGIRDRSCTWYVGYIPA